MFGKLLKKMKVKFDIYLPFENSDIELTETTKLFINELIENTRLILIPLDDFGETELTIEKTTTETIDFLKKEYTTFFRETNTEIIHFASTIEFEVVYEFKNSTGAEELSKDDLNYSLITSIFESRFQNFLTFTQIAIPGSLLTNKGLFLRDEKYYHDIESLRSNLLSVVYEKNVTWPHTDLLSLLQVWNYIKNETCILTKKSLTNIENGLNAFSYLIENNSDSMQNLFWAMSGIEALYAEGGIGIGYQIDMKSKLFLGEPNENKNILKKLYNFRSKFIHGSMNIPISNGWFSDDSQDEYDIEFYDMECLATRLLTATLQMIIKKDMRKFEFEFKLIE